MERKTNIFCLIPSLSDIKDGKLYKILRAVLGDSIEKDLTLRTLRMESKTSRIIFGCCRQETLCFGGFLIDMAIIATPNITEEWEKFLRYKTSAANGIMLRAEM